jgi:CheY-like chemotaxis protein
MRFLLMRRGYSVLDAEDGPSGIALASKHGVACALVDVNMPGMDGVTVCRALRKQAAAMGREIAVWLMTGARSSEVARLALEAGALVLLQKPFDIADLFRRIEEQIGPPPPAEKSGTE